MINKTILVGRLTADPTLRYTQSGIAVANFTIACDRPFTGQDGKKEADFISVVVWRKQAENVAQYLKKGSLAGVEGRLQTSSYEGDDGQRRYKTEVVADAVKFLSSQKSEESSSKPQNDWQQKNSNKQNDPFSGGSTIDIDSDDLPF